MKSKVVIQDRIDELWGYTDYGIGPEADRLRHKHQGMIDALTWVMREE
ncbi:hypothetical protein SAMN04488133_1976 [Halobellus limi]|uniref:Uncharacterized protein n=1 Tax=Halobellus limi TaxID=699433 RepID=A0A1H5ZEX1_9EURY|nr:hypothetical protein SAMN04488133_1976 [Halobellus limi]